MNINSDFFLRYEKFLNNGNGIFIAYDKKTNVIYEMEYPYYIYIQMLKSKENENWFVDKLKEEYPDESIAQLRSAKLIIEEELLSKGIINK